VKLHEKFSKIIPIRRLSDSYRAEYQIRLFGQDQPWSPLKETPRLHIVVHSTLIPLAHSPS